MVRKLLVKKEEFPLLVPFKIAHGTRDVSELIYVRIIEDGYIGEGESCPYNRYGESCESVLDQIEGIRSQIESGISIEELQNIMPAGAARNAVDCALWALEAKKQGEAVWEIANLPKPKMVKTAYTISINEPHIMEQEALEKKDIYPIFKIKLAGDGKDKDRMCAVRKSAPINKMVVDANESWNKDIYKECIDMCQDLGISMIEQPFISYKDNKLQDLDKPITVCADESCHTCQDLDGLIGKYDMVNIKLDKTGGLTEAIKLVKKAKELNFQIMVGCMISTSLGILPAYYISQLVNFIDIDSPLFLAKDRNFLHYDGANVSER